MPRHSFLAAAKNGDLTPIKQYIKEKGDVEYFHYNSSMTTQSHQQQIAMPDFCDLQKIPTNNPWGNDWYGFNDDDVSLISMTNNAGCVVTLVINRTTKHQ
jgi:hypothetical protein